ncbi:uncharacterized protein N7459_009243 [Penicillium hispanicum]|uniref:uncharacterized protein n=1 Tax=Penicillium hispanicum TaxID=1080232 RepID=UPI00253FCAEF|nr:uncharacterized protein N7459_009243 [Penicillium hispanicum]KAJ5569813.1 hypothetical protein N7459_009243 [Penicillium hispanicum]
MPPNDSADVRRAAQSSWDRRFDRKPISSNPMIADLDVERNELAQTWKSFIRHLPPDDRVECEERPPTARDVQALVRNLQTFWMSRPRQRVFGPSITLSDRFLPAVETHAALLAVLHDPDLSYASLFYGVLQSVIKASSNYPRVMEGLITALLNIQNALAPLAEDLGSTSVEAIARIYALIFFFLADFMDWYVRKSTCHLLKSHNQDAYAAFHPFVNCIQRQARDLSASSDAMDVDEPRDSTYSPKALWEESQISQVGRQGEARRHAAQNTMTRRLIWDIQQDSEKRDRLRETRDQLLAQMLSSVDGQLRSVSEKSSGIVCLTTAAPDLVTSQFEWSRGSKRRLARLELQSASKHLQAFFDSDDQIADLEPDAEVVAEDSVVTSLQKWVTSPRSQVLAVGGPLSTDFPYPVASLSACYASFAREARLPVISHFCSLPTQEMKGQTLHQQGLIALTYSLIRQMIDSLPTVVDSDSLLDLTTERFRNVDGTLSSWTAALSLVDTLLHFAPPLLVCIIDGIDKIHDASTDAALRELIRVLLTHTRHQPPVSGGTSPAFLFKVLFTVAGRPSALVETMSENELILSESTQTNEPAPSDAVLTSDLGVMMNA